MVGTSISALILGATGATGKHLLREVLLSESFSRVGEYGRSLTQESKLPDSKSKAKLEQKKIDYENLNEANLNRGNWDVVFITMGTTRAQAGSPQAFERIDKDYVINAARAAKSYDTSRKQRLVYLSSGSANADSNILLPRSKGLTEIGLAALGYDDVIIFRPGLLMQADRPESRIVENIAEPIVSFFSRFTDMLGIPVSVLGKSIRLAGELGSEGIPAELKSTVSLGGHSVTILDNSQAVQLAQKE